MSNFSVDKRIGNDYHFSWGVSLNGGTVSLSSCSLSVEVIDPRGNVTELSHTLGNGTVEFNFLAKQQKFLGYHTFLLTIVTSGGQRVIDKYGALRLVPYTVNENPTDNSNLTSVTIALPSSNIALGIKGKDFTYDDFTEEQIAVLQKPALDAAEESAAIIETANEAVSVMTPMVAEFASLNNSLKSGEQTRIANETARQSAEAERVSNETSRESYESTRKSNEQQRQVSENNRSANESQRNQAETNRKTAESQRESNEAKRASGESSRSSAETIRVTNEYSRTDAERTRVSNETERVSNESSRRSAETSRANSETERVSSEETRVSNETTRQSNEQARVSAETSRATAEAARATAEQQRVATFSRIGNLSDLETEDKTSIVAAINELHEKIIRISIEEHNLIIE